MQLKMISHDDTMLKHGEPFLVVNSEKVACVCLPIEDDFDPELITAGITTGIGGSFLQIGYAEDEENATMLTIIRQDGESLKMRHGHHSTSRGRAEIWVFDPTAYKNPPQLWN